MRLSDAITLLAVEKLASVAAHNLLERTWLRIARSNVTQRAVFEGYIFKNEQSSHSWRTGDAIRNGRFTQRSDHGSAQYFAIVDKQFRYAAGGFGGESHIRFRCDGRIVSGEQIEPITFSTGANRHHGCANIFHAIDVQPID